MAHHIQMDALSGLFGPVVERSNSGARMGGHSHAVDDQTAAVLLLVGADARRTAEKGYSTPQGSNDYGPIRTFGLLGNNIGVLDLYSRYDAPKRISNSRSSYTFTKTSNAGANRMSTQSTNSTD